MDLLSVTELQRNTKRVLAGTEPFRMIVSNNQLKGALLSKEAATLLEESGILQQIREELWELADRETTTVIRQARKGVGKPIALQLFRKKYGL